MLKELGRKKEERKERGGRRQEEGKGSRKEEEGDVGRNRRVVRTQ